MLRSEKSQQHKRNAEQHAKEEEEENSILDRIYIEIDEVIYIF